MTNLYPPVLDSKAYSIPYQATVPQGVMTKDYYEIIFAMPSMNSVSDIRHIQVVIKYQATNQPAVNTLLSPDKATLFIDATLGISNNFWQKYDDYGNYILKIPYWAFDTGKPKENTTYTVQVRFGANSLWAGANDGLQGTGFANFASWRQSAVTTVPSMFGEWSNMQTVYCYAAYATNFDYNYNDFVPELIWFYQPKGDDPIEQVKILYIYQDFEGKQYKTQVFNGQYNQDNTYTLRTQIPIAPFFTITGTVEAITQNNTLVTTNFTVLPLSISNNEDQDETYGVYYRVFPSGKLNMKKLEGEELNDGILAVELSTTASPPQDYTVNVYRINLLSLQTIRIAEGLSVTSGLTQTVKDYTVEMGEEYEYVGCLMDTSGNLAEFWWNPTNPYGTENAGYGRLMKMDSAYLTNRKHQLRLQGNVTVSNFKRNTQDLFQTTIGSPYPFYSRNAMNNYRTLNLQATISINFDPTSSFLRLDPDNGLFWDEQDTLAGDSAYNSLIKTYTEQANQMQKALDTMMIEWQNFQDGIDWEKYKQDEQYKLVVDAQLNEYRNRQTYYEENIFELNAKVQRGASKLQIVDTDLYSINQWSLSRRRTAENEYRYNQGQAELTQLGSENPSSTQGPKTVFSPYLSKQENPMYTTDLSDRMVFVERKFRELVMSWLSDGTPKLFRSETEGNMIVAVTAASFTPYNKTRLIYNVSCTLTEIAEYNLENLILYNLIPSMIESHYSFSNDYDFVPGDEDPNVNLSLIYQYNPIYDIPSTQVGRDIKEINTMPAVLNGVVPYKFIDVSLPDGIEIDENTGVISGAPTTEKLTDSVATVMVQDGRGATATMTINVGPIYRALTFAPITQSIEIMSVGVQIEPLNVEPLISGGIEPYQFFAQNLPLGIYIDRDTGEIHGAYAQETEPGTAIIIVVDANQNQASQKLAYGKGVLPLTFLYSDIYNIPMMEVGFEIDPIDVSGGVYGGIYDYDQSSSGYLFSMSGAPEGLTIDEQTGVISGAPRYQQNSGSITITVKDFAQNEPDGTPNEQSITISFQKVLARLTFTDIGDNFDIIRRDGEMIKIPLGATIAEINLMPENGPAVTGGLRYETDPPYRFSSVGLFPNFEVTNWGIIRGTTTNGGIAEHDATIIVTDRRGRSEQITVRVSEVTTRIMVEQNPNVYFLPEVTLGKVPSNYGFRIPYSTISGGIAPYTFTYSNFPSGVEVVNAEYDGQAYIEVRGTPDAIHNEGVGTITIMDSSTIKQTYDLSIPIGGVYSQLVWVPVGEHSMDIPRRTTNTTYRSLSFTGISGGKAPYTFQSENLSPYGLSIIGASGTYQPNTAYIQGAASTPMPEGTGTAIVVDALGNTARVTFKIGEVYEALSLQVVGRVSNPLIVGQTNITEDIAPHILQAYGGTPPYTYSLVNSTTIPGGLQLITKNNGDGTTGGYLFGKPTTKVTSQDCAYLFKVTDNANPPAEAMLSAGVEWLCPNVYDKPVILPPFDTQNPYDGGTLIYNQKITPIGPIFDSKGYPTYTSNADNLPQGIYFDSLFNIWGTPQAMEPAPTDVTVRFKTGANQYTPELILETVVHFGGVVPKLNLAKQPTNLELPAMGVNQQITPLVVSGGLSGGSPNYIWSATGLPAGLRLNYSGEGRTCTIEGTPTTEMSRGDITITVRDKGGAGDSASITFPCGGVYPALNFIDSPSFDIPSYKSGQVISEIDVTGAVSGGVAPYTYSMTGAEDHGYTITPEGTITGTASSYGVKAGQAVITVRDYVGQEKSITINVGAVIGPLQIIFTEKMQIPAGKANTAITQLNVSDAANGGEAPYTWQFDAQQMPTEWNGRITINPTSGIITGSYPQVAAQATTIPLVLTDSKGTKVTGYLPVGAVTL